jgi:methyltransferase
MKPAILLLGVVTTQRLFELWFAARNTAFLRARGAVEHGAGHYPFVVVVHSAWLVALWILGRDAAPDPGWLAGFGALQILRVWVMLTLGRRWTTRVLVVPEETLVRAGPYRFLAHPNDVVVAGEIAVLPLCLGLPGVALVFSLFNAVVLAVRIRVENAALAGGR